MSAAIGDRRDYMSGRIDHHDYYGQFVTDGLIATVSAALSEQRIRTSDDPHFNDIPLEEWDQLAKRLPARTWSGVAHSNASTTRGGVSNVSLSDKVCLLKATARRIQAS